MINVSMAHLFVIKVSQIWGSGTKCSMSEFNLISVKITLNYKRRILYVAFWNRWSARKSRKKD